jgi:hypothetical protein
MYMNFSSFQMTVGAIDIKCVTTGVFCSLLARVTQSANVQCNEVPNKNEAKLYRSVKKLENCDTSISSRRWLKLCYARLFVGSS